MNWREIHSPKNAESLQDRSAAPESAPTNMALSNQPWPIKE